MCVLGPPRGGSRCFPAYWPSTSIISRSNHAFSGPHVGPFWVILADFGSFWPILADFGPLSPSGWFLCILGVPRCVSRWFPSYWTSKSIISRSNHAFSGPTWGHFGSFWVILGYFGRFWPILAPGTSPGRFLCVLGVSRCVSRWFPAY